jgi:hypothetical protein
MTQPQIHRGANATISNRMKVDLELGQTAVIKFRGYSVCPPIAAALARANCPEVVAHQRRAQ